MSRLSRALRVVLYSIVFCCPLAAQVIPAITPSIDSARVLVVGQNMHNYFLNFNNSFSESKNQAALDAKTDRITNAFAMVHADVYAMCELEVSDTVVGYITRALNEKMGSNEYAYIHDKLEASQVDGATKVGFIYRTSTIRPLSSRSTSSSNSDASTYGRRMRWIGFEEICSGEKFVVSMNHFKAKDSSSDQGESQRMTNAQNLYRAMSTMTKTDPDILVLGDLNCPTEEAPIQYLINTAGLEEQLVRYDANAYSYRYQGQTQLIDHAMANAAAAEQVTGAGLCHVNTQGSSSVRYSDHDMYVIGLRLGDYVPPTPEPLSVEHTTVLPAATKCLINGQIYILRDGQMYSLDGRRR